jgi:hypothetical protein
VRTVLIYATLLLIACGASAQPTQKKTAPPKKKPPVQKPLTAKEIFAKYRGAMVQIKCKARRMGEPMSVSGSGFFYQAGDVVATAYHVIEGAEAIEIVNVHGAQFVPVTLKIDVDSDIALIQVSKKTSGPVLKGKLYANVQVGETVFAIGNTLGMFPDTITHGIVSGKRKYEGIPYIQTSAPVSEGNSGGPLFDDQGRVLGVVDAYMAEGQNTNFAVAMNPVETLRVTGQRYSVEEFLTYNRESPTRITVLPNAKVRPKLLFDYQLDDLVGRVAMSPDGSAVALASENEVAIVSVPDGKIVHRAKTDDQVVELLFASPDRLFLFRRNKILEVRNPRTWENLGNYTAGFPIYSPQLTGNKLVFTTSDLDEEEETESNWRVVTLDLGDGTTKELRRDFGVDGTIAVGDSRVYGVEREEKGAKTTDRLVRLDSTTGERAVFREEKWDTGDDGKGKFIELAALSPDAKTLAVGIWNVEELGGPALELFDSQTGQSKKVFPKLMPYFVLDIAFAGSDQRLLASGLTDLYMVDLGREAPDFKIARNGMSFGASKDAGVLAVCHDKSVRVYSLIHGTEYKGEWLEEDGSKSRLTFGDNDSATLTFADIPGEQGVTMRIIGTWLDQGDEVQFKVKDVQVDGLLDSEQGEVAEVKKMFQKAGTLTLTVEWLDHDSFKLGVLGNSSIFRRK